MFCNSCNNGWLWILIILILLFSCGGNTWGSCGCGCENNSCSNSCC